MHLREAMEDSVADAVPGTGTGRKKLKQRLAAILSVFSRRAGGRKRRDSEGEAKPPAPLAFPSYSRIGSGKKQPGGGSGNNGIADRRLSLSAPRPAPLVHITIDCAGRRSVDAADPSMLALDAADAAAGKKAEPRRWSTASAAGMPHETSEWEGRKCPPSSPFMAHLPPLPPVARWKERASTNTNSSTRRLSTHSSRRLISSSSSDDEYDDDSRNLFSSRSFSSDSSDFYNCPRKNTGTTTRARASVSGPPCRALPAPRRGASQSCRYSFELPRGSTASAATDGGFAVVKRSADPYEDFRKSMQEMIAEWPAAGGADGDDDGEDEHSAERLLETYLVLNSPRHYPAILAAFADVRETLFP